MPLTNHFTAPNNCKLAVWKIEESEEDLAEKITLTLKQRHALTERKTVHGRQGYLAVRSALVSMGIPLKELSTSEEGVPQLVEGFCSLSHSDLYATAVYANEQVGIDIEAYRPKILRIAKKFTHKNELVFLQGLDQMKALTRLWTAKEAIYKALKKAGLSFSEQIEVLSFDLNDSNGSAKVYLEEQLCSVQLQFSTFDQHELTIAHSIQYESID